MNRAILFILIIVSLNATLVRMDDDDEERACASDDGCAADEICHDKRKVCKNICGQVKCGDEATCRFDKKERKGYCVCNQGFRPKKGKGCVAKEAEDETLLTESIKKINDDTCDDDCCKQFCSGGKKGGCNVNKGSIECYCNELKTKSNPFKNCGGV